MTERCSSYRPLRCNLFELTENEKRILGWMNLGMDRIEIAMAARVKPESIYRYRKEILDKLGASTDAEAIQIAKQRGLIP